MVTMQDAITLARSVKMTLLETEQHLDALDLTLEDIGLSGLLSEVREFLVSAGEAR